MSRILLLLLVSVGIGTAVVWSLPGWQQHILEPGAGREFDTNAQPIEITIEVEGKSNTFIRYTDEEARMIAQSCQFSGSDGLVLSGQQARVEPATITWVTKSKHSSTTHHAPGLLVRLHAAAKLEQAPKSGMAEISWGGAGWAAVAKEGRVVVRRGEAQRAGDRLLLGRFYVAQPGVDRVQLVLKNSLLGGAAISLALLVILLSCFGFPRNGRQPPEPQAGAPLLFERSFSGARSIFAIFCGIIAAILTVIGVIKLTSSRDLIDLPQSISVNFQMGSWGLLAVMLIGYLALRLPRAVQLSPDAVEIFGPDGQTRKWGAAWEDIKFVQANERFYKGSLADEWLEFRDAALKKVKISRKNVQHYQTLKSIIMARFPECQLVRTGK